MVPRRLGFYGSPFSTNRHGLLAQYNPARCGCGHSRSCWVLSPHKLLGVDNRSCPIDGIARTPAGQCSSAS